MANTIAYGFTSLTDLFNQRVTQAGTERIFNAIEESATEYSRVSDRIMSGWSERTVVAQEQIEQAGEGTLQPIDEWGNPLPVVSEGSYQVAYPIHGAGTAWGANRVSRALMTVEEANRNTMDAFSKDADWMIRHALAAILDNTSWVYNDKAGPMGGKGLGNITVRPLANSDSAKYNRRGGIAAALDSHYLAQAAAIDDSNNPFPTMRSELVEHPENRGPYVAYVASSLVDSIGGLAEFVEVDDPDIQYGADNDTLPINPADMMGPGTEVLGKTKSSNVWVVEMPAMPAGYMICKGDGTVIKQREYDAAELQGFFPETHSDDGNTMITRMLRYTGFGVHNRIGAVAYRIGGASYAIPSGYETPLAV